MDIIIGSNSAHRIDGSDGNDTIIEEREADGKIHGIIKINNGAGVELFAAGGFLREGSSNLWHTTTSDGTILTLTHTSSWELTLPDGGSLDLGADFQDSDFGIKLVEDLPVADFTFSGPSATSYGNAVLLQNATGDHWYYEFRRKQADGSTISLEKRDFTLNDIPTVDLSGGSGNDYIIGSMGEDTIDGGENDDILSGKEGADYIFGGQGKDVSQGFGSAAL